MVQFTVSSHQQVKSALSQARQRQLPGGISCQVAPLLWQEQYQVTVTTLMRGDTCPETRNKDQLKTSGLGSAGPLPREQHTPGSPCTLQGVIMSWRTAGAPCSCWALHEEEGSSPKAPSLTEPAALAPFCHACRRSPGLANLRLPPAFLVQAFPTPKQQYDTLPHNCPNTPFTTASWHLCRNTERWLLPLMSPGASHLTAHNPQDPLQEPCGHHPL